MILTFVFLMLILLSSVNTVAQEPGDGKLFLVTLDSINNGLIQVDPPLPDSRRVPSGTVLKITATPAEGFSVDSIYYSVPGRWGAMYHESLTCEFEITIDQDKHIGASFIKTKEIEHISVKHNIVYAQPGKKKLKYDVYSPKSANSLPIVVIIHGGAWATNDEDIMRGLARELTRDGKLVACSIDYRWIDRLDGDPSPNTMANLIEDVFGAIAHIREHAADYGGDPDRIGVTGDSAGGHLSAVASLMVDKIGSQGFGDKEGIYQFKPTYLPTGKSAEQIRKEFAKSIKAAAPSYGVFAADRLKQFMQDMPDEAAQAVAPINHIPNEKDRPVPQYLTRGTKDGLILDTHVKAFEESLKAKNQMAIYDQVENAGHAFFDWKPTNEVKKTFVRFGIPYAARMREFFVKNL